MSEVRAITPLDYGFDADRVHDPESLPRALRRRVDGRYPSDQFGLDPHLSDLVAPALRALVRVDVRGEEHLPARGPAVLVANRGFGVFEPAALAVAVLRSVGRRLRIVGAPALPVVGELTRRLGAISATPADVAVCLRQGHLVGVPLAPTWLRTGAGTPPLQPMQAVTHTPIVPVAVAPGGPFGTTLRPWRVLVGPLVTLPEEYDPDDPLTAARFAEAARDSVRALLQDL